MQIVSLEFLFFFACTLIVYYIVPGRLKCLFLLVSSYFFYGSQNIWYLVFLATDTLLSYGSALLMNHAARKPLHKKIIFVSAVMLNMSALGYFKYAGFLSGGRINSILLPVGISFYLFTSCGYLADVYHGRISAEKNLIRYALFVSFFPTILSGPIERAGNMLPQFSNEFFEKIRFDTARIRDGFVRMLWGYFLKLVLADRIAIMVNSVYASPAVYGGVLVFTASVLYTFQIYCDFAGYSHIAIGIAEVLGIRVMENFKCPYLAVSISDFWRRWHISLSSWFRDYVYIPLGGNRKGTVRKYVNIMIVFLLSGLWHGVGWTFILWGGLHGIYQVSGALLMPVRRKFAELLKLDEQSRSFKMVKILVTFCMVSIAWILFRVENLSDVVQIFKQFAHPKIWELFDGTVYTLGLDRPNVLVMIGGLILVIIVDLLNEREIIISKCISRERLWIRWPVYIAAVLFILVCGIWGTGYDTSSFIYYQF